MAAATSKKHSFASVVSNIENNSYLTSFPVDDVSPAPSPTNPVLSYDRRDSWSSSRDSFYTLDEEPRCEPQYDRSNTPRPGMKISMDTPVNESHIESPVPLIEQNIQSRTLWVQDCKNVADTTSGFQHRNSGLTEGASLRPSSQEAAEEYIHAPFKSPQSASFSTNHDCFYAQSEDEESAADGITEQELRELEDEITLRPRIKSKKLDAMFGEDPASRAAPSATVKTATTAAPSDLPNQQPRHRIRDFADIMEQGGDDEFVDRLFGGGEMLNQSYDQPTSATSQQREADKRDFADLILGRDDGRLADKLFGGRSVSENTGSAKATQYGEDFTSAPQAGLGIPGLRHNDNDRRDFADLILDGGIVPERLLGGGELPGQSYDPTMKQAAGRPARGLSRHKTSLEKSRSVVSADVPVIPRQRQQSSSVSASSQSAATTAALGSRPGTAGFTISRPSLPKNSDEERTPGTPADFFSSNLPIGLAISTPVAVPATQVPHSSRPARASSESSVSSLSILSQTTSETTADSDADLQRRDRLSALGGEADDTATPTRKSAEALAFFTEALVSLQPSDVYLSQHHTSDSLTSLSQPTVSGPAAPPAAPGRGAAE